MGDQGEGGIKEKGGSRRRGDQGGKQGKQGARIG